MPKKTLVQRAVEAVVAPKVRTPKAPAPEKKVKCDNCDDSGKTCSVCRTGYDV